MYNVQCFLVIVNSWIVTVRSVHSNVTKNAAWKQLLMEL